MFLIASDHGGLELKESIKNFLEGRGIEVRDLGTMNGDSVDYPDYGAKVGRAVSLGEAQKGILICGTGIGMSIVANKFPGVRAALISDEFTARMSKEHNNANIIVMGGRVLSTREACDMVAAWLDANFEGGRHQRRLEKIAQIEQDVRQGRI
ncbi:ribose 5-phosphate isomerase B [Desulfuromonas versatilis]|uniref:Ribose 5-phosphate isomerase B n=1 Tax=Desulfuromonas versatilis TaxID=2802975 RepID=A0ABM8HW17_9BACT|nr:ribose 5-phosphate isomerase B [Desulfuromonas versatilis]BCR04760.1 ribose 5-phosphate isomerase B [Desulfuromonas versatilis]